MSLIPSLRPKRGGSASRERGRPPAARKRASAPARKPAPKKPAARKPAPRKRVTPARSAPPRELDQRHLDLIGLAMLAAGLYLGFVLYAGGDGGSAGSGLEVSLRGSSLRLPVARLPVARPTPPAGTAGDAPEATTSASRAFGDDGLGSEPG